MGIQINFSTRLAKYHACWSFHCSSSHFSRVGCKNWKKTSLQVRNSASIGKVRHINTYCELLNMKMLHICSKHAQDFLFFCVQESISKPHAKPQASRQADSHQLFTTGGSPWPHTNCLLPLSLGHKSGIILVPNNHRRSTVRHSSRRLSLQYHHL